MASEESEGLPESVGSYSLSQDPAASQGSIRDSESSPVNYRPLPLSCTNQYECEAACPKEISVRWITKLNRDYAIAAAKEAFGNAPKVAGGGD